MGKFIAESTVKKLIKDDIKIKGAQVGILGLTFKENVPDLRNTKVVDIISELKDYGVKTLVHDAMADPEEAHHNLDLILNPLDNFKNLDALILTVPHDYYKNIPARTLKQMFADPDKALVIDAKGFFDRQALEAEGISYWRL